jgi:hypothetical protein
VSVIDLQGRRWRVKWGDEVRSENFAVRFAWACGYFAGTTYFVASGRIEGAKDLTRARDCIDGECRFVEARFELDDPGVVKMFEEHSWAWNDKPFVGTRELNGLKIVVMLLSNWDTKDRSDIARGSNTAIFEHRVSRWRREAHYLITDWGRSRRHEDHEVRACQRKLRVLRVFAYFVGAGRASRDRVAHVTVTDRARSGRTSATNDRSTHTSK